MQLPNNKLIISVAGSGKTTYLVRQALEILYETVVITTYTEANEKEIRKKFYEINGSIPANITIQTWFSFLIQHGVKPYQGTLFDGNINGMLLVNASSGINYRNSKGISVPFTEEKDFLKHYFTTSGKIYSDKLSKFVIRCNEKSNGMVVNRLAKIYDHLFIDEVQDLAGNDLELLRLFFKTKIKTTLVGDPRQVTYLTHNEKKNNQYKDGKIKQFILDKCKRDCVVDELTLQYSHRNSAEICDFSSKLYPDLPPSMPCDCIECRNAVNDHSGIFLVKKNQIKEYIGKYSPTILKYHSAIEPEWNYGNCKGLGFDRVLIHPTEPIIQYLKDGLLTKTVKDKSGKTRVKNAFDIAKLYVALTRARYSVGIIYDYTDEIFIEGIRKYN
ncbi:hypothetical protein ATE47_01545 [Chryseobacterium sp. IHB B 17019]|uniref:UvrD-helicase domain-containing protein n=1 Tax=Chryseobacterium sp. IHB B 17019 TaxID=1721091 RepID=UPI000720E47B|nr:UvrD-helicase domain-containing protein [Chryseobacterium sp. IHB B 17019]ALR29295.1 hypothetical protein ATE47_01545 [Chryseobacterium sp. IHB B 17019]